jgi:hypothetical protein
MKISIETNTIRFFETWQKVQIKSLIIVMSTSLNSDKFHVSFLQWLILWINKA